MGTLWVGGQAPDGSWRAGPLGGQDQKAWITSRVTAQMLWLEEDGAIRVSEMNAGFFPSQRHTMGADMGSEQSMPTWVGGWWWERALFSGPGVNVGRAGQ